MMTFLPGLVQPMVKQIAELFSRDAQPEKGEMCQLFSRVHEVRQGCHNGDCGVADGGFRNQRILQHVQRDRLQKEEGCSEGRARNSEARGVPEVGGPVAEG
eukprot:3140838-Pyramimonas_sp.AAC.1